MISFRRTRRRIAAEAVCLLFDDDAIVASSNETAGRTAKRGSDPCHGIRSRVTQDTASCSILGAVTRASLPVCFVIALTGVGCGSSNSAYEPVAPTVVSSHTLSMLTINGRTSLDAIGETSQLNAVATFSDKTVRDVTSEVGWTSQNASVASVSSSGLVTAVGFGAAQISASYPNWGSLSVHVAVTPAGTFAVSGQVREPGQGAVAGVRVLERASGRSVLTDASGNFMLALLAGARLRFDKDGYEPGERDIAPDHTAFMAMQRIVRIAAGETAIVPKLTHMDMSYDVGPDRCSPCRLIRIVAATAGPIHFDLTWDRNPGAPLYLWAGGQRFERVVDERRLEADAVIGAGEQVVYVGYYRWTILSGSSIAFTLATSVSR